MSSLVGGIVKIFTSIAPAVATGAATLGTAIRGVGATLFTAAAATGKSIINGLSGLFGGTGILGSMSQGAQNVVGSNTLIGGTGNDVLSAASTATGLGGAAVPGTGSWTAATKAAGSLVPSATAATGFDPISGWGAGAFPAAPVASSGLLGGMSGLGQYALIAGAGQGLAAWYTAKEAEDAAKKQNEVENARIAQIRGGYNVDKSALVGGTPTSFESSPGPAAKDQWAYNEVKYPETWVYDPKKMAVVKVRANQSAVA